MVRNSMKKISIHSVCPSIQTGVFMVAGNGTIEAIKISFSGDLNLGLLNPHICIIFHFKGETNCRGFKNTVVHTI
jgi:hypothetical protein